MSRTPLVAGNWKMNQNQSTGLALINAFVQKVDMKQDVDVAICPPFTLLAKLREALNSTHIQLGAQDVFWADHGAFTGLISAPMLTEFCVSFCIVGHSETRGRFGKLEVEEDTIGYFAETNKTVNLKIKSLLYHGINPILCVGETLAEREAGNTESAIKTQLDEGLAGIDGAELHTLVIAYEPVWAIGTGKTCASDEAERICGFIRDWVAKNYPEDDLANDVRVLYGGSVKAANSKELFSQPNIDGGLVGGASLDPAEFAAIVANA